MRHLLITGGIVVNAIELDEEYDWTPDPGHIVVASTTGNIGDTWNGTRFIPPPPAPLTTEELFFAKLHSGCAVFSKKTPELSAIYPLDDGSLGKIAGFAARGRAVAISDTSGKRHQFSPSDLEHLSDALADYVEALHAARDGAEWPSQPVSIA